MCTIEMKQNKALKGVLTFNTPCSFFFPCKNGSRKAWTFSRTEFLHSQQLALKLMNYLEHVFSLLVSFPTLQIFQILLIRSPGSCLSRHPSVFMSSTDQIPCLNQYIFFSCNGHNKTTGKYHHYHSADKVYHKEINRISSPEKKMYWIPVCKLQNMLPQKKSI